MSCYKGFISGFGLQWLSTTQVYVEPGQCRDQDNTRNLDLTAAHTVAITSEGADGLDSFTTAQTYTTHGNTACEASADVSAQFLPRTHAATLTTVGAAATASAACFGLRTGAAIGDLIGNSTLGYSRITAIASVTSATIVAALPGGDAGAGSVLKIIENPTLWPDTATAGDQRMVNTLSAAGTDFVLSAATTSNGAGKTGKIGVEVASKWYYVLLCYGTSGYTCCLSTQRTEPYAIAGYDLGYRLLGAVWNTSGGDIDGFNPVTFDCFFTTGQGTYNILNHGHATIATRVSWGDTVPPIAEYVLLEISPYQAGAGSVQINVGTAQTSKRYQIYSSGYIHNDWVSRQGDGDAASLYLVSAGTVEGYLSAMGWGWTR